MDLDKRLNLVDYGFFDKDYRPTQFALEFIAFVKMVNGSMGEENKSPIIHYDMLDQLSEEREKAASNFIQNLYVSFRGSSKTTVMHEYMFLYLATYGGIKGIGEINVAMYISDTMENGVKSMRNNLEFRWSNSEFLQKYVPVARFTDVRWQFENADGKRITIRGFGATPLALDEIVYTEQGTKPIGEVQIGETVYGSDGTLANVVKKSEVFHKDMYKITLRDGRSLRVSHDHLNSVFVKVNHKFVKKVLTTEEILTKPIKFTGKNEYRYAVPMCEPIQFPEKVLPVCPYTLGLLLGDGSSRLDGSNKLTGSMEDLEFYSTKIPYRVGKIYEDARNLGVGELPIKKIHNGMRMLGLQSCVTYDKFIPEVYKVGSIEQRLNLLQGLMDTDGTIYGSSRMSFTNTSKRLIEDVQEVVESLGGYTSLKVNPAQRRKFKGYYSDCRESFTLSIFITLNIFKIPRKADKFVPNELHKKLAITKVEKIPQVPSVCIGLDNDNHEFVSTRYFVTHNTGVRGFKEYGERPTWCSLDDLMSDKNSESPTIIRDIKNIVYKAARQAMHPKKRIVVWTGTPFNKSDPFYEAASGKAWNVRVYPICEKFPCSKEEFRGAWEDRFPYSFVKNEYYSLLESGEISSFNQELMLRITSEESRLVMDSDLVWYNRDLVVKNRSKFNFYITTDFATSDGKKSDYSVCGVWAYTNNGEWLLVDGFCKRQLMDKNIDQLFRYVAIYRPLSVGIEINGQQKGFIQWLKGEMISRNIFFNFARQGSVEGIRRTGKKIASFKLFVPQIKAKKVWLPEEMKTDPLVVEILEEMAFVTDEGFQSKHDDAADMMSMLTEMDPYKPGEAVEVSYVEDEDGNHGMFVDDEDEDLYNSSTIF